MSYEALATWLSISSVSLNMKWGQRANGVIFKMKLNGLAYILPDINQETAKDPITNIMGGVAAAIRSNNINGVVPLVAAFEDASLPPGVETLAELLDIK